jgi:hypothetical protein
MSKLTTNAGQATAYSTRYSQAATESEVQKAKSSLEKNGFNVKVIDNLDQARQEAIDLIPEGSEVFTATSRTLENSGLDKELNESGKYVSVRDIFLQLYGQPDKAVEMRRIGSGADYALGSVHAVTEDGQLVIASASGSQLPNYAYGASHVIWLVGSQKIVKDLNQAFDRIENYTFHLEDERAQKAYGKGSSINKLLIYRKEPSGRGTVILIREPVGF